MRKFSLQLATDYTDDTFTSDNFEDCLTEAYQRELEKEDFRIAEIEENKDGIVTFTYNVVNGVDL